MNNYYKIALAGLLHDIGKFYQRAGKGKNQPYQEFKYQHALFTHQWFEDPEIKPSLSKAFNNIDEIRTLASKHHKPDNSLESKVLQKADHLSSEEREKEKEDEFNLLHTAFERVSFIKDSEKEDDLEFWGYYKLKPLDFKNLEDTIFPVIIQRTAKTGKLANPSDEKKIREEERKYPELYEKFLEDFKKINYFKEDRAFNFIYYLLQKYLWCVPASKYDKERGSRHYPDISLFDHSRVLSAIAVCLYDYIQCKQEKDKQEKSRYDLIDEKEKVFLLYEAEISGIQKFIYKVSKADVEEKGFSVPKELRGRSFFVSILPELLSRYILNKLDYPITNILYSGGGKFQLLLPNTNKVKKILQEFKKELSEYLHREFHLDLLIVDGRTELSQKDLKENKLREAITNLQISIDEDKKRKAKELLTKDFETDGSYICKSCRSLPREKEEDICKWCYTFNKLGEKLAKHEKLFIIYQFEDIDKKPDLDFGKFGKVYLLDKPESEIKEKAKEILSLNSTKLAEEGYNNGFKFIANIVPILTNEVKDYLLKYVDLEEKDKKELEELSDNPNNNPILPLNYIAEFAKGDKKLAVLRADVDNLGLIFSDGLRRYTISRIATLSRMLDLFFTGYISILINKVSEDYAKRELGNTNLKTELIYTVYAGGDDLFLIGPYNLILHFAVKLRKKFYTYTANNTDFGISGGIAIVGSKVNIEYMAKISEEMESISKSAIFTKNKQNYLKDAITIFEKSFKYSSEIEGCSTYNQRIFGDDELLKLYKKPQYDNYVNFETILRISNEIAKYIEKKDISRALAYRLLSLHRVYVSEDGKIDPVIYPKIFYQIGRNVKDENVRNLLEEWLLRKDYSYGEDSLSKENVIRNLDVILSIALMKTRGGKKDD